MSKRGWFHQSLFFFRSQPQQAAARFGFVRENQRGWKPSLLRATHIFATRRHFFTLRFEKIGCDLLGGYKNVKIDGSRSLQTDTCEKDCPLQCDGTQAPEHSLQRSTIEKSPAPQHYKASTACHQHTLKTERIS